MKNSGAKTLNSFDENCCHWRKVSAEKFLSFRKRFSLSVFTASTFYLVFIRLMDKDFSFRWEGYFFTIVIFFVFTEILFLYDRIISRYYPWVNFLHKRVVALFLFSTLIFVLATKTIPHIQPVFVKDLKENPEMFRVEMLISFLYMIIYVVGITAHNFHESLKYFLFENEKLKQDKLISDYKALQDQLNPHFLFNNLSTLIAIIRYDPQKAIAFTESFTDVYRYVLTKEDQVAVSVREELVFIRSYIQLHSERTGGGIIMDVDVDDETREKKIPHLSLQVLVENAIKHNVTSRSKPLYIKIGVEEGRLYVYNAMQLKETTYSTHTGLSNLGKRLKILTDEEIAIVHTDDFYKVTIPLID